VEITPGLQLAPKVGMRAGSAGKRHRQLCRRDSPRRAGSEWWLALRAAPGYQVSRTAATSATHGITTGSPVLSTTTVCGFTAATAAIRSSW